MKPGPVHQLVHGYATGHTLLAGSAKLSSRDLDLVTRLSDLSGTLAPDVEFSPYITMYPLASEEYYAVAKTWPDPGATRSGCVLTHTLLVPLDMWAGDISPSRWAACFQRPDRDSLEDFSRVVVPPPGARPRTVAATREPRAAEFVQRYFGEGLAPIAWIGATDPIGLGWLIVHSLWPALRSRFACCTFALQPRALDARPFDLLFAPSFAVPRFTEFARGHIVGERTSIAPIVPEPWSQRLTQIIFEDVADEGSMFAALKAGLGDQPTNIRSVFFFLELRERASASPTAALGALDLLETILPEPSVAAQLRSELIRNVLSVVQILPSADGLEALYLLSQRVAAQDATSGALSMQHAASSELASLARSLVAASPEDVLRDLETLLSRYAERVPMAFFDGVADGLAESLRSSRKIPEWLTGHSGIGQRLLEYRPGWGAQLLVTAATWLRPALVAAIPRWLVRLGPDARRQVRLAILPLVDSPADVPLMDELLRDVDPPEVPSLCDIIDRAPVFSEEDFVRLPARMLGERYPVEVRQWASVHAWKSAASAWLVAATFPFSEAGLADVLALSQPPALSAIVLAAFVLNARSAYLPAWLRRAAEQGPSVWSALFSGGPQRDVMRALIALTRDLRRSAILRAPGARAFVEQLAPGEAAQSIQEHALRQLVLDFLDGLAGTNESDVASWLAAPFLREPGRQPFAAIRNALEDRFRSSRAGWPRAWKILRCIPPSLTKHSHGVVCEVVAVLLANRPSDWLAEYTADWLALLRPISDPGVSEIDVCAQALKYALDNRRLPVSGLIAEVFFVVHQEAMADRTETKSWHGFRFTDWDKARHLRRSLVESFYKSDWDPADFAFAAREPWLFRKLVKRMLSQWSGTEYLEKCYARLRQLKTEGANVAADIIQGALRNPNFSENWD